MNRIVIITGATGGIGYHLCCAFAEQNYTVVAMDNMVHKALPDNIHFIMVDLSDEDATRSAFIAIKQKYGKAHILINNAAIPRPNDYITEVKISSFDEVIAVNLRGAFICSQEFVKLNEGEEYGRIINIASTRYHQNEANWEAYGVSKGAIVSLTNSMCVSLSGRPITVNAISPGWIQTDGYNELQLADHSQHPSQRVGIPRDITNTALFLANQENDFINGANIIVDGGMTKKMIYSE